MDSCSGTRCTNSLYIGNRERYKVTRFNAYYISRNDICIMETISLTRFRNLLFIYSISINFVIDYSICSQSIVCSTKC